MPGFLLSLGATVLCAHGGQALPAMLMPRVKVMGQPAVTLVGSYTIVGCANPLPPSGLGPCVTAQWATGAARIKIMGQPAVLSSSQALCTPTGTPLVVAATQMRVKGI